MRKSMCVGLGIMLGMWVLSAAVRCDEEKIALDKLPKAVTDAVKKKFPDAELKSAEIEKENGKDVYEVVIKYKDQAIEVVLTPEGKIIAVEKEMAAKDLPKAVTEAIDSKYAKATIKKVEELTKDDKVTYEVVLSTADKKIVIVEFDAKGKVVQEEKKEEKKKDK